MAEIKIIRLAPGVGYMDGNYGHRQTKNGGKIAGNVAAERARQRQAIRSQKGVYARQQNRRLRSTTG